MLKIINALDDQYPPDDHKCLGWIKPYVLFKDILSEFHTLIIDHQRSSYLTMNDIDLW